LELVPHFLEIEITFIIGNESRITLHMPATTTYQNWDFILAHMVKQGLSEYIKKGHIKINIPKAPDMVLNKMGHTFVLMHGHTVKSWAGLPIYGLMKMIDKQRTLRKDTGGFDVIETGHFHCAQELMEQTLIVNGCLVGNGAFARNTLHLTGKATQTLYFTTEENAIDSKILIQNMGTVRKHPYSYSS
jgi:predicted phosphodiesterase